MGSFSRPGMYSVRSSAKLQRRSFSIYEPASCGESEGKQHSISPVQRFCWSTLKVLSGAINVSVDTVQFVAGWKDEVLCRVLTGHQCAIGNLEDRKSRSRNLSYGSGSAGVPVALRGTWTLDSFDIEML
jgi:hypothetical protein